MNDGIPSLHQYLSYPTGILTNGGKLMITILERVNYGLRLYQFNMRGRNETLRLTAQFGFQRRFELSYRFPYIDKKQKHGLILDVDFTETKNLAFQTVDHRLEFLKSEDILRTTRVVVLLTPIETLFMFPMRSSLNTGAIISTTRLPR